MTDFFTGLEHRHLLRHKRKGAKHPLLPADSNPDSEPKDLAFIDKDDETGAAETITGPPRDDGPELDPTESFDVVEADDADDWDDDNTDD